MDAFPDGKYTRCNVTAEGKSVVIEAIFTGTHLGTYVDPGGDIPASNRTVEGRSAHAVVVENGLVTEVRMYFDVFSFLAQLGVLPAPAATA